MAEFNLKHLKNTMQTGRSPGKGPEPEGPGTVPGRHGREPDDREPESREYTLFSFDEDEGLSEHTAPYDAVVTILDGQCEVWVAGTTHQMKEGETIIFRRTCPMHSRPSHRSR